MSRRGFLTGTGAAAAAVAGLTAELAPATAAQPAAVPAFGPAPVLLELTVNGKKVTTNVEPRVTLLDALRNYLDVTGCKRVCDRGTCGACTVMLDGKPVYSCTMLALEAHGADDPRRPSRSSPAASSTPCRPRSSTATPSSAASARPASSSPCGPPSTRTRTPRPREVEEALAGNICRCGTYEQMRHAIVQLCKKGG